MEQFWFSFAAEREAARLKLLVQQKGSSTVRAYHQRSFFFRCSSSPFFILCVFNANSHRAFWLQTHDDEGREFLQKEKARVATYLA